MLACGFTFMQTMSFSSRRTAQAKGKFATAVSGRPSSNSFNPSRSVACEEVQIPYGRIGLGETIIIVDRMGDHIAIGIPLDRPPSYEMLPEGRADAFLEKHVTRELDQDRAIDVRTREETDGVFRMDRIIERLLDSDFGTR